MKFSVKGILLLSFKPEDELSHVDRTHVNCCVVDKKVFSDILEREPETHKKLD